jgi:hypothetical protein
MTRKRIDPAEKLAGRIDSKRAYIRYLKARATDRTPIEKEIERHEALIAEHMIAIERLQALLVDLPTALMKAEADLLELMKEQNMLWAMEAPKKVEKSVLQTKIEVLQQALRRINDAEATES